MNRSTIIDIGIELANEIAPDDSCIHIHTRLILEEFTRKLADRLLPDNQIDPTSQKENKQVT